MTEMDLTVVVMANVTAMVILSIATNSQGVNRITVFLSL